MWGKGKGKININRAEAYQQGARYQETEKGSKEAHHASPPNNTALFHHNASTISVQARLPTCTSQEQRKEKRKRDEEAKSLRGSLHRYFRKDSDDAAGGEGSGAAEPGLLCAAGDETVTLQEVEGTTITLHTGITGIQSDAQILWFYGPEKGEEKILNSQVFNGKTVTEISERFKERLQLDRTSGALTIRNISRNLSGVYLLQVLTGRVSFRTFSVSVYAPVSAPVMRIQRGIRRVSSTELCFLLCCVENGEDVKLSWYRENERISITNNTDLSVPLNLTLQIQHPENNRNSYICVSANPVSNKTTSLNITQLCYYNSGQTDRSRSLLPVLISTVFFLLLISIPVWVWLKRKHNKFLKKLGELTYTEVEFTARSAERVKKVNISIKLLKMIMRLNVSVVLALKKNHMTSTGVIKSPPIQRLKYTVVSDRKKIRECLLCAAGDETVTLQEVEGTTITLHTGITGIQSDAQILWFYGPEKAEEKTLISQVFNGKTVTDISERFKERLQLDRISGALTIRNISRNLSGVYLLHVITDRLSSRTFSVSVYGLLCAAGDETVTLQEVEGTTITLHTGITGIQSDAQILWFYGPEKGEEKILISQVFKGETVTEISERFKERLQLDRISGALTIRNISRNLSGVYLLQVLTPRLSSRTFSISVYAPVSAPVIRNQRGNRSVSSTEPCFLLCSVENGEDVKLSWYRENERISITSNTDLRVPLNLTLQIEHTENNRNSYICVSANPASNKTTSLNIAQLCYYNSVRADKDAKLSDKRKGGRLALFINTRWCNPGQVNVKVIICCRDIELLAVACEVTHSTIAALQTQHPEAFFAISGDFNHVTLDSTLPAFHQFVDCPTRKNRTIDLLYVNVRDAYRAIPLPPLGRSDHNLVVLQPQYKPMDLRQPITMLSFRAWSPKAEETLKDCFETTDWNVLLDPHEEDIEELVERFVVGSQCSALCLTHSLLCAAGDETVTLQEVEGTTITLHTGITGIQSDAQIQWFYGPEKEERKTLISQVFKGETVTEISERFKERLQLDRISGALTIRNISRNLSEVYLLHVITEHLSSRTFSVSVYAPVSAPVIRNQRGNRSVYSTEPCFLLCSVENGEDVKLSWYRENERISFTNNTDLSVPLNLTLQIQHTENNRNSYICVSANPVSNKTTSLNIIQLCCYNSGQTDHSCSLLPVLISTGVFLLLISIPVWVWLKRKHNKFLKKLGELTYTEVEFTARSAERVKKEEDSRITDDDQEQKTFVLYSVMKRLS
ncbi:uncharacterized protein LOC132882588 [Neoarius graeffei]|uniref:uncharacterized protein LOC132882588 n=1 Tax=Neoarius graeffei TaxID=443677 RepID=UPI00298BCD3E|nr:uncharacterized protein LOC132882588 [Neoarius graeffei]